MGISAFTRRLHGVFDAIDRGREACDPQEDDQLHGEGRGDECERAGRAGSERSPDASEADNEHLCWMKMHVISLIQSVTAVL